MRFNGYLFAQKKYCLHQIRVKCLSKKISPSISRFCFIEKLPTTIYTTLYQFDSSSGLLTAIPEPSNFALLLGGKGALALLRRRRA
jgi:hypothetical protein